jgi:FkbM family methyltransferase
MVLHLQESNSYAQISALSGWLVLMISALARFANDCYHIFKSPSGSRAAILKGLVFPGAHKMGFHVAHFDRLTLNYLYREVFARQSYFFRSENVAPVILDCGANIGMASLYFKWLYPHSQVQAFEPDPATFKVLQSNIAVNHLDVVAHHCALFESNTEIDLFVDRASPGGLLMSTDIPRSSTQPVKEPARRLSDFITGSVDFLKLDV